MTKFDLSQIRDPSTDGQKIETSDYVREMISCAKFYANLSIESE